MRCTALHALNVATRHNLFVCGIFLTWFGFSYSPPPIESGKCNWEVLSSRVAYLGGLMRCTALHALNVSTHHAFLICGIFLKWFGFSYSPPPIESGKCNWEVLSSRVPDLGVLVRCTARTQCG